MDSIPSLSAYVVEAACDWLTATAPGNSPRDGLREVGYALLEQQQGMGMEAKRASQQGYEGFRGDHMFLGWRPDSTMLTLSGWMSAHHWLSAKAVAAHITRMDIQATVAFSPARPGLSVEMYHAIADAPKRGPAVPKRTLMQNGDGGQTCYIGSRTSDVFLRCYDKGRQRNILPEGVLWRYEVQSKRLRAAAVASSLARSAGRGSECDYIVHGEFTARGAPVPWASCGTDRLPELPRRSADDERTLDWLRDQVAPAIARLTKHGHLREVHELLRLQALPVHPADLPDECRQDLAPWAPTTAPAGARS